MGNGIYSPYGTSKKTYALCTTKDGVTSIKMYQCALGAEFDRTVSVSKCVYKCTSAGKFVYSLDVKKYYNCALDPISGKLVATLKSCTALSETSVFVPKDKDCGFVASLSKPNVSWKLQF